MRLAHEVVTVRTTRPFVIARGGATEWRLVHVHVTDADGIHGWGEAAPSRFYGETVESAVAALDRLAPIVERCDGWSLEALEAEMNEVLRFNGSVKSAVSAAVHDLAGKRLGLPVYRLLGLNPADAPQSSYTIAIASTDEDLVRNVHEAAAYPVLKVKLGTDRDREIIRAVRSAAPDKVVRVDANAAWTPKHAVAMTEILVDYGVEFVEQPVPAHDLDGLRFVRDRSRLPVVADESCLVASDVPKLVGVADGINIKLSKCGGLREALKMVATARSHGMLVMMGCMIDSSLGITAAAHLAPLVDAADLDGAALLAADPFVGATIDGGRIEIPAGPGLGVTVRGGTRG
jgi:L-alanine-DL-glutamate epimerase-like enolase superfamily enzyme